VHATLAMVVMLSQGPGKTGKGTMRQ